MHVSNLPPEITKEALLELFNTTMHAAKLAADEASCINDVHMAPDGRYAFLEFRSVMECSNAMMLDGIEILGRWILHLPTSSTHHCQYGHTHTHTALGLRPSAFF